MKYFTPQLWIAFQGPRRNAGGGGLSTIEKAYKTFCQASGQVHADFFEMPLFCMTEPLRGWKSVTESYLVGTARSKLKQFEQELLKDDFEKIRPEVEVKQIRIPGGE